jgi:hypothetical protein
MPEVPKIVRERLKAAASAASDHPDPDVLTAFSEQSLPQLERNTVLEHLSRCIDCREVLALALPAAESIQAPAAKHSAKWFAWPALRWGFASAGLAAIALFGFLHFGHRGNQLRMANNAPVAAPLEVPREPSALTDQGEAAADERQLESFDSKSAEKLVTSLNEKKAPVPPSQKTEVAKGFKSPPVAGALPHGPRQMNQWQQQSANVQQAQAPGPVLTLNSSENQQASASGAAAIPGPPAREMLKNRADSTVAESKTQVADSVVATNQVALKPNTSESDKEVSRAKSAPASPAIAALRSHGTLTQAVAFSPTWTITSGRLQRSFDQGVSWQDVNVNSSPDSSASLELAVAARKVSKDSLKRDEKQRPAPVTFRAVAANGLDVWAGGTESALYHSTDAGTHWVPVFPTSASGTLTGDILTLEFSDVQNGRLSTSTGEIWTTADNGQSWKKQ